MKSICEGNININLSDALFTIDENIDIQNIETKYVNGVLTLNLPKKPEVKATAKKISVQ